MPLFMIALLTSSIQAPSVSEVTLFRGASLFGSTLPNYQDVEDTTLDQNTPDSEHGGDYTLIGGSGHTILVRFGSLADALGPNVRIKDAKLLLAGTTESSPKLSSIGTLTRPWGEGAFHVQYQIPKKSALPKGAKPKTGEDQDKPEAPPAPKYHGASWKNRFENTSAAAWQAQGAISAPDVVAIAGATTSTNSNVLEIDGLGPAVQSMLSDPGSNNGFALSFETDAEFFSSECAGGKPRLVVTLEPATNIVAGDIARGDLAIETITPENGGYTARIHNFGTEPVANFKTTWTVGAREGSPLEITAPIGPGEIQNVHYDGSGKLDGADHSQDSVALRIESAANDKVRADKHLKIYPNGIPLSAAIAQAELAATKDVVSARGVGLANWVQSQLDVVNEIYLARSRFSFAPEGCLERVRLAQIMETGPLIDGPAPVGTVVEVKGPLKYVDYDFIRRVLFAIGAPDLGKSAYPRNSEAVKVPGWNVSGLSIAPDFSGGGDTRYDGNIPSYTILSQVAVDDPSLAEIPFEPNGLLSATAVGILNELISVRPPERSTAKKTIAAKLPTVVFVDASDANGRPFKMTSLEFFQSHGGVIGATPEFSVTTSESGAALLPNRAVAGTQLSNPFGTADLEEDGTFLVRASANGETAWAWMKGWQLQDAALRGDGSFASVPLYFMMPGGPIDRSVNHAQGHVITDSAGSLPAKLAPLVDGQAKTIVELPSKPGAWIEIDLNRDWTIDELRLTVLGEPMWSGFKILVYQTGMKPEGAITWASEVDWPWSAATRGNTHAGGGTTVSYNGPLVQIRYVRIVCTRPGKGSLAQIEAFSTKASP